MRNSENMWGRARGAGDINARLSVLSRAFRLAVDPGVTRSNPFRLVARVGYQSKPFLVLDAVPGARPGRRAEAMGGARGPARFRPAAGALGAADGDARERTADARKDGGDFGGGLVIVKHPKWRRDPRRTGGLPVCEEALKLLAELCARTGGRLFTDDDVGPVTLSRSSNLFRRRAAAVGLAGMGFHFLRRTFDTRLGEAGVGPYAIARLMGHSNIKTSMIYVHPPVESLRRAAEAAASRRAGHSEDTRRIGLAGIALINYSQKGGGEKRTCDNGDFNGILRGAFGKLGPLQRIFLDAVEPGGVGTRRADYDSGADARESSGLRSARRGQRACPGARRRPGTPPGKSPAL